MPTLQEAYSASNYVISSTESNPMISCGQPPILINKGDIEVTKKTKRPRVTSHRSVRTVMKEIDNTYKAKKLTLYKPMKRCKRVKDLSKERGVTSTRNMFAWNPKSGEKQYLMKYSDTKGWTDSLLDAFGFNSKSAEVFGNDALKSQFLSTVKKPSLKDRKQHAQYLAQNHYHTIMSIAEGSKILGAPKMYKGTYTPECPSLLVLLDMTKDAKLRDTLALNLKDVTTPVGDTYGSLFLPIAKSDSFITAPVEIIKFTSFLDKPSTAWKSVKGTKMSSLRLYMDREGIHTGAIQDLDTKIERTSKQGFKAKLIVVHDEGVDMTALKDVVTTSVDGLKDMVASRLRNMGLHYVE